MASVPCSMTVRGMCPGRLAGLTLCALLLSCEGAPNAALARLRQIRFHFLPALQSSRRVASSSSGPRYFQTGKSPPAQLRTTSSETTPAGGQPRRAAIARPRAAASLPQGTTTPRIPRPRANCSPPGHIRVISTRPTISRRLFGRSALATRAPLSSERSRGRLS